jgi:hypothetical protein
MTSAAVSLLLLFFIGTNAAPSYLPSSSESEKNEDKIQEEFTIVIATLTCLYNIKLATTELKR